MDARQVLEAAVVGLALAALGLVAGFWVLASAWERRKELDELGDDDPCPPEPPTYLVRRGGVAAVLGARGPPATITCQQRYECIDTISGTG